MWGRSPECIWLSATVNVGGSGAVWERGKKREGERENMMLHDKFIWGEQGVEEMLSFPPSLAPLFSCCHLSLSLNKINMYMQTFVPPWRVSRFYFKKQQISCPLSFWWRAIKHKKRHYPRKILALWWNHQTNLTASFFSALLFHNWLQVESRSAVK